MRRRKTAIALAAALLLLTTGCGARWSDAERAALIARTHGTGTTGAAAGAGGTGATGAAGTTATGTAGSTSTGGTSGGGAGGGGTGTAAGAAAGPGGPLPCSAASDAPGVTADTIAVGNISSVSGPVPGLGSSSVAATRAYVAYRNANGGVCGRQIDLKAADDATDSGQFRAAASDLGSRVLGLVGELGGGDAGGADVVEAQHIPVVTTAISEQFQNASTVFDMNPPFADVHAVIGKYRYLYDQGVRKAALVLIATDQTRSEIQGKQQPQMEAAGIQVVSTQELPLSTLSFDSAARTVANSGADYLLFLSAGTQNSDMARAIADTGYHLKFAEYLTAYGSNFVDLAGTAAAEGATSWIRTLPNEETGNPEQAAFLEWMDAIAPDVPADTFAADAWASSKAFFDALEQLPGPISRDALIAQLHTFNSFDAGGFEGTIDLGNKRNNGCFIGMRVVSGAWTRFTPAQGFLC